MKLDTAIVGTGRASSLKLKLTPPGEPVMPVPTDDLDLAIAALAAAAHSARLSVWFTAKPPTFRSSRWRWRLPRRALEF